MFTTVAFVEEIDEAGAFANIAAALDQHMDTNGDRIRVPDGMNTIMGEVAFVGTTGTRARLTSPSLEQFQRKYISPVNQVLVPTGNDVIDMHRESMIPLVATENLEAEINANPAAAEWHSVGVWLTDGNVTPITGDIRPVPFSVTVAVVAGVWTIANITLEEELNAGNYQLVGARLECNAGPMARVIIQKQFWRPGFLCTPDEDFRFRDHFRYGKLGEWGTFNHISLPQIEILGTTTPGSATYQGLLDVVMR